MNNDEPPIFFILLRLLSRDMTNRLESEIIVVNEQINKVLKVCNFATVYPKLDEPLLGGVYPIMAMPNQFGKDDNPWVLSPLVLSTNHLMPSCLSAEHSIEKNSDRLREMGIYFVSKHLQQINTDEVNKWLSENILKSKQASIIASVNTKLVNEVFYIIIFLKDISFTADNRVGLKKMIHKFIEEKYDDVFEYDLVFVPNSKENTYWNNNALGISKIQTNLIV